MFIHTMIHPIHKKHSNNSSIHIHHLTIVKDNFPSIKITPVFRKTQKRTKYACIAWQTFIILRWFVPKPRKLGYSLSHSMVKHTCKTIKRL